MRRCFVCAADMLMPSERRLVYPCGLSRAFPIGCASCGVLMERDADASQCWKNLAQRLGQPVFMSDREAPYGLDIYTLRSAATKLGRGVRPVCAEDLSALRRPHGQRAARAKLFGLDDGAKPPVSLGLLCRADEREAVLATLPPHSAWTDDVAILLDAQEASPYATAVAGFPPDAVRVAARPLGANFGGQRNALQKLARHDWMLQLDADETLDPAAGRHLPALAGLAEAGEILSVGLPRRNRVDDVVSDVYPDVQYRLNRTSVRFSGRVHERPHLDGGWPQGFIALHGVIEHALSLAHVLSRSQRYEALDPGRGRIEEEARLLQPYHP